MRKNNCLYFNTFLFYLNVIIQQKIMKKDKKSSSDRIYMDD